MFNILFSWVYIFMLEKEKPNKSFDKIKTIALNDLKQSDFLKTISQNQSKQSSSQPLESAQTENNLKQNDNQFNYDTSNFSNIFKNMIDKIAKGKPALQIHTNKKNAEITYHAYVDYQTLSITKNDGGLHNKLFMTRFKENIIYLNKKPLTNPKQLNEFVNLLVLISNDLKNNNASIQTLNSVKEV